MTALNFPRFIRISEAYRNAEPLAARICREHCGPRRILWVEDDKALRAIVTDGVLSAYAADFLAAGSVAEAKAALQSGRIDAVLMDIRLGDGNGVDLYRWILERWPDMDVCFLTAYDDTTRRLEIEQIGPARVFAKSRLSDFDFMGRLMAQLHVPRKAPPRAAAAVSPASAGPFPSPGGVQPAQG